jgi:hypothetical protein
MFNYMPVVMPWIGPDIRQYKTKRVAVQHLYDNTNIGSIANSYAGIFDHVAVLDPSVPAGIPRVTVLPRVIPVLDIPDPAPLDTVHIGTFGFALPHKQIPLIAREINRHFDNAVFNLHITEAYFNGAQGQDVYTTDIVKQCEAELNDKTIKLNLTTDYCSDTEVVNRLSKNHINALFYAIPPENVGRSSSIDYMIAAERPILVTHCDSFAHANHLIHKYPTTTFADIINNYDTHLAAAKQLKQELQTDTTRHTDEMIDSLL